MHHRAPSPEAGFSLIELVVAIFVLLVGVLGTVALVDGANRTTSENRAREAATNLTREMIEDARSVSYGSLDATTIASRLAAMSGGTVQADGTVAYVRRGVTYTATPSLCYFDDPKDGYGSHAAGATYCNANTGTTDTFPLDYKRFTVVTTWDGPRGSGTSRQSAVINDPGSSFAPQITAFAMTAPSSCTGNPACSQIDAAVSSTATFTVSTSVPAAKVTWYVDDTKMGTATGSGTGPWNFTWALDTVATGSHTVSVRASSGKDGAVRNIVVPVRESPITAPTNPFGGTNQLWVDTVELSWTPFASSVLGYEVDRLVGGVWSAVTCYDEKGASGVARTTASTCMDKAASGATQYRIFTVYSSGGTPTRTASSANVTIATNQRPCPPASVTMTNGTPKTLTWTAVSSEGVGSCDTSRVSFFRVYRREDNGTVTGPPAGPSERVFKTSGANVLQWVDPARTSKSNYWVTAVDDHNAESIAVGPVK